jgi:CBS domain-containing protein
MAVKIDGRSATVCAMKQLSDADGLKAIDLVHRRLSTVGADVTIGQLREYFAASDSRRLAVLVDGERYVGMVDIAAIPNDVQGSVGAADYAVPEPTIEPDAPAEQARDMALAQSSQRLPVVDANEALVGIIAIDRNRTGFCGT